MNVNEGPQKFLNFMLVVLPTIKHCLIYQLQIMKLFVCSDKSSMTYLEILVILKKLIIYWNKEFTFLQFTVYTYECLWKTFESL